jgi:two-component system, OmpR family, sensor histidine kinase ChvG
MKKRHLFFSISFRLFVFNLLILIFPIASFLFLNTYEEQLLRSLEHALVQQGRVIAAALGGNEAISRETAAGLLQRLERKHDARFRIIDSDGAVLADSSTLPGPGNTTVSPREDSAPRETFLYRLASLPVRLLRNYLLPPAPPIESGDYYQGAARLLGSEVQAALSGRYGAATRISTGGQISVTLYSALPVFGAGRGVIGAVLVSQSSYRILQDLYRLRIDIFTIFLLSLLATVIISIFLSITISRPLKTLSRKAEKIFTPGGKLQGQFSTKKGRDEIGKLASTLDKLTAQLREHIGFIESFAGDVSHELKNPIASIRSSAEIAGDLAEEQRDGGNTGDIQQFLAIIQKEAARMETLISSIREISNIDARLPEEGRERIDLVPLFRGVVENSRIRNADKALKFDFFSPPGPVYISAAPERIIQVGENLIDNAVSFSPSGSRITVRVESAGGSAARLTVIDEGPGIPDEIIQKIFNRFFSYRTGATDSGNEQLPAGSRSDHAGLGLAIVKAIVEGYGGTITAKNNAEGGAAFTVILPAAGRDAG